MTPETISRSVVAGDYEEAMRLALVDWRENWADGRVLCSITISEDASPGWRTVRGHLRTDFSIIFGFSGSPTR